MNLPEHADNIIHTDAGARAAGFAGALVAGTTVYAYLTHPPAVAWGDEWLARGGGEVRFSAPVLDGDLVECLIDDPDGAPAVVATVEGEARARFDVWPSATPPRHRSGEPLPDIELELGPPWADYGVRAGDDLTMYSERGLVHPAAWLVIANHVFRRHLVEGPWIHTRSRVVHRGLAAVGDAAVVRSTVVARRDSRAGERAVVDITVSTGDRPLVAIEHEAVVRLA